MNVSFTLNGAPVSIETDPKTSTLDLLREQFGILTVKGGCAPQGLCGCCTALINGTPRLTCTLPAKSLVGKTLVTLEGLPEAERQRLASAFLETGASQCGYCTPGILTNCAALLGAKPDPSTEEIAKALNQHLCRCTGYTAIFEAVQLAAEGGGQGGGRPEGEAIVLGERPYVDDLQRPGMLFGTLVFASVARGRVGPLDLEAARGLPGVELVLPLRQAGDLLEFPGEPVVAIAAVDAATARQAAALVKVEVEPLPPPMGRVAASGRRREGKAPPLKRKVAASFEIPYQDPAFLEPFSALAVPTDGEPVLYTSAQDPREVSEAVGRPVQIRLVPSGGSYGGRRGGPVERAAVMLAVGTGRPVRVGVTMEEGSGLGLKRPAVRVDVEAGLSENGSLGLLKVQAIIDGGSRAFDPDLLVAQVLGCIPYAAAELEIEVELQEAGGPLTGGVRGGAAAAVMVAVEQVLDQLAEGDRFAFRRGLLTGEELAVLEALEPAWALEEGPKGLALARMDGAGGARVVLHVAGDAEVEVHCSVPELGQGRDETLLRVLREQTGLPLEVFHFPFGDGDRIGSGTFAGAPVEVAARRAAQALVSAGGRLMGLVGRDFVGEDRERAEAGISAALTVMRADGVVEKVYIASGASAMQGERMVRNLAEGAAHMGTGIALSEAVEVRDGQPESRLRMLGIIKPKSCPPFLGVVVPLAGGPRDVSEAAVVAVAASVVAGVSATDGILKTRLPLRDSPAGKAVGARPSGR